jgi:diadenosine tetraphosphate (Ap4A) HIT family hydrolase
MGDHRTCPFCALPVERIIGERRSCVAFADAYPVSPGHTLIAPRRHIASFFDTKPEEREEILQLIDSCRKDLVVRRNPAGFNIGINDGIAAGQTVMHLHVHLIPRYSGDRPDPRGGIRWIFPDRADYWSRR